MTFLFSFHEVFLSATSCSAGMEEKGELEKTEDNKSFFATMRKFSEIGPLTAVMGEFEIIRKRTPDFLNFLKEKNAKKNRYPQILLLDNSRVILEDKLGGDYIHASYGQFSVFFRTFLYMHNNK